MLNISAQRSVRSLQGFTLLELLTAISVIGILCAIGLGMAQRAYTAGRQARTKTELAILSVALEEYRKNQGDYPQTDDEAQVLQSLLGRRDPLNASIDARCQIDVARFATSGARDPFTDPSAVLLDPWGQPYVYAYKIPAGGWINPGFVLYSIGPDGRDASALLAGGLIDSASVENADNIYANRYE